MHGTKRWPPLLIPQLPVRWIAWAVSLSALAAIVIARAADPSGCAFGSDVCPPMFQSLERLTVLALSFCVLTCCALALLGVFHVIRRTVSWLMLDVFRIRAG